MFFCSLLIFLLELPWPIFWHAWFCSQVFKGFAHLIFFFRFIRLDNIYWSLFKFSDSTVLPSRVLDYFHLLTQCLNLQPTWLPLKGRERQESSKVLWDVYITALYIPLVKITPYSHNLIAREAGKYVSLYDQDEENGTDLISTKQYICHIPTCQYQAVVSPKSLVIFLLSAYVSTLSTYFQVKLLGT